MDITHKTQALKDILTGLPARIASIQQSAGPAKGYYTGLTPNELFDAPHWHCQTHQDALQLIQQLTGKYAAKRGKDYGSKQTVVYLIEEIA